MKKTLRQDTMKLGWLDFSLSALASSLACFSVGMGLRVPEISWFLCGWIAVGSFVSFLLSRAIPEKHTWVSGLIYSVMAVGTVMYTQPLNDMLPKGGFPIQLIIAASLAWMLLLGSFLTWRDSTVVFQAVPSIALFGLVGAWDTFSGAPFAFFGFLLCFATLFARAHGRSMILQAEEAGFTIAATSIVESPESRSSVYEGLRRGPWKWVAGPEWALGSAAVIVLLSVLGAPVLQTTVQPFAGFVRIQVPTVSAPVTTVASSFNQGQNGIANVGQGPRPNLRRRPVFTARVFNVGSSDRRSTPPTYFRVRTYDVYTGRGWRPVQDFPSRFQMLEMMGDDRSLMNRSRLEIDPYRNQQFEIELRSLSPDGIPIPGDLQFLSASRNFLRREDGTIHIADDAPPTTSIAGMIRVPEPGLVPEKAVRDIGGVYTSRPNALPERVRLLAEGVTQGITGDYQKAMAIKRAIGQRVEYSLDAPPVPAGSDPAEFFLFDSKVGYCDLYATAMVTMARSIGLPARYVTGYYPALGIRDRDRRWVLHESEAHAWAEIFFAGHGWVVFDATEGAIHVGDPTEDEPWMERGWFRATVFTIAGLAVVLAPFGIAYAIGKRKAPKDRIRSELGKQYERFISGIEKKTGKPKRPSQTPQEYFDAVIELIHHGQAEAGALNARFIQAMYSSEGVDDLLLGSLRDDVIATLRAVGSK